VQHDQVGIGRQTVLGAQLGQRLPDHRRPHERTRRDHLHVHVGQPEFLGGEHAAEVDFLADHHVRETSSSSRALRSPGASPWPVVSDSPTRQGVAIKSPDPALADLMPLLGRSRHHRLDLGRPQIGPATLTPQRFDQRIDRSPTLDIELQLIQPRLMPQGVRHRPAQLDLACHTKTSGAMAHDRAIAS
jgi:hypothetical protein